MDLIWQEVYTKNYCHGVLWRLQITFTILATHYRLGNTGKIIKFPIIQRGQEMWWKCRQQISMRHPGPTIWHPPAPFLWYRTFQIDLNFWHFINPYIAVLTTFTGSLKYICYMKFSCTYPLLHDFSTRPELRTYHKSLHCCTHHIYWKMETYLQYELVLHLSFTSGHSNWT